MGCRQRIECPKSSIFKGSNTSQLTCSTGLSVVAGTHNHHQCIQQVSEPAGSIHAAICLPAFDKLKAQEGQAGLPAIGYKEALQMMGLLKTAPHIKHPKQASSS
jgi:hypothetical protein